VLRFAAITALLLSTGSSATPGGDKPWTAYEKWTGTYTITISDQRAFKGGKSHIFKKAEGTATLDEKESYVDPSGVMHVMWHGACDMSAKVDEEITMADEHVSTHITNRGQSKTGAPEQKSCATLSIDSDAKTYSIDWPAASASTEEMTIITAGDSSDKQVTTLSTDIAVPLCCKAQPLPGPGSPLKGSKNMAVATEDLLFTGPSQGNAAPLINAVITWDLHPQSASDAEAVIEPEEGYDDWSPEAPSGSYEPRPLEVKVRIHKNGDPGKPPPQTARFKFELQDTSGEPGYCMNAPKRDDPDFEPPAKDEPYDLQLVAKDNPELKIGEKGQSAESKAGLTEATVKISSLDWGGYARLKVTAILKDGTEVVAHLKADHAKQELLIPRDDNDNHVADTWEKSVGVFDENLAANWDGANDPHGQRADGDGISLYEKYRGFEFDGEHESLDPRKKFLFLHDSDGIYRWTFSQPVAGGLDFASLSGLNLRLIDNAAWTGPGFAMNGNRIVNFNHRTGHAVDQHAVDLSTTSAMPNGFLGITLPDGDGEIGPPRTARMCALDTQGIRDAAIEPMVKALCALPRPDGQIPLPPCDDDEVAYTYVKQHKPELFDRTTKEFALIIVHELSHAVGVEHHEGVADGDHRCIMRYFKAKDCRVDPNDPVELKCRNPWPYQIGKADPQSHDGKGCYGEIIVSDRK
jgi:hypothetical protein